MLSNGSDGVTSSKPKAYINYIFFDDQMRYAGSSGFSQVGASGAIKSHWDDAALKNIVVPKNGYVYVYVSNGSPVEVYFANLQVIQDHWPIANETHYCLFGLQMARISGGAITSNKLILHFGIVQDNYSLQ
jgi:hypothetical protein